MEVHSNKSSLGLENTRSRSEGQARLQFPAGGAAGPTHTILTVIVDGENQSNPVVDPEPDLAARRPGGERGWWSRGTRFELLFGIAAALGGLAQRAWILATPRLSYLDSDEAVVGLMARQFPGQRPVFFWGQFYGGVAEPLLTAVVFRVFGASVLGLKIVPIVLCAIAAVLVGLIGRHLGRTRAGVLAASIFWIWPAPFVWWSTKSRGFYWIVIVAGLVAILMLLQLAARDPQVRSWAWWSRVSALGLALGVGWWSSPQIALLVVPLGVWFAITHWSQAWRVAFGALPGFVIGSFPWWWDNLRSGFRSLEPPTVVADPYPARLWSIVVEGTPMALGVKVPYWETWIAFGPVLGAAIGIAAVLGAVLLVRPDWRGPGAAIVATLALYPFLAAVSPLAGYVGEGRYLVFAAPLVALLLGALGARVAPWFATVGVGALGLLSVSVLAAFTAVPGPAAPNVAVPDDFGGLIEYLDAHDITTVEADYWIAYRISFETNERVLAATTSGIVRNDRYQDAVKSGADARVFVEGSSELEAFRKELRASGVDFPSETVDGFVVYRLRQ